MKNLILMRHAKSSWKEPVSDFKRPLNKRGLRDAPFMGKLLKKLKIKPDIVLSSPALRASETAKYICEELSYPKHEIRYDEDIYEASDDELLEILNSIEASVNTVIMLGHNPGLTELANYLSDKDVDNIPTAGVVSLSFQGDSWSRLSGNSCHFNFFEYPKKHFPAEER